MSFHEQWLEAVRSKNSVLCAGLDLADTAMGRGAEGLPEGADKETWAMDYLRAVAPYCVAVKPNIQYWQGGHDAETLAKISKEARRLGLVVIQDRKLADIGSTNDAGVYATKVTGAHAVTIAPYAGNVAEAAAQGRNREIGTILMCLMSNPEYRVEKSKWVDVSGFPGEFDPEDVKVIDGVPHVRQYVHNALAANVHGIDGVVIGAPSAKNHISQDEIARARRYSRDDTIVLFPGLGKQGGEVAPIWQAFGIESVIVNVGRALMFPASASHAETARNYRNMLNAARGV